MSFVVFFAAALALSGHCALMCGAFPVALRAGVGGRSRRALVHQTLYHAGKTATYVLLGTLAAAAGLSLPGWRRPLGLVAGMVIVAAGVVALRPPVGRRGRLLRALVAAPACWITGGLRAGKPSHALFLGLVNGFLPCGVVYALLAHAASRGSPGEAAVGMLCFGAGTVPALSVTAVVGHGLRRLLPAGAAAWSARASGVVAIVLGLLTLLRTFAPGAAHAAHLAGWIP